jgi:LppP/LprE lipoprotein
MSSKFVRTTSLIMVIVTCCPGTARAQVKGASWLDEPKPASWNKPSLPIPAAPTVAGNVDPRCKELARPPQLEEDKRLRERGWQLVGAYQGGWRILVIRGTAGYDGMCRPRQYQDFVFVRDAFIGTLAPHTMDSRTDGALRRVSIASGTRLTADYERYAATDPLCCPSRTTTVAFEIASNTLVLQPVSASTSARN